MPEKRYPQGDELTAPVEEHIEDDELREESEAAFAGDGNGEGVAGPRLLSFYDHLRDRVLEAVEERSGRVGTSSVKMLLLVPDIFILLVRLALDKGVPSSARTLIGGALAYFVLPVDLLPEALLGVAGYVDDLVLAAAVLSHTFSDEMEPYVRRHWSGPDDIRVVLADIAGAARSMLGVDMYARLEKLLAKRGVEIRES